MRSLILGAMITLLAIASYEAGRARALREFSKAIVIVDRSNVP